jgi:uncharacterized membrane protein YqaE (UPF0057 family)
MGKNNPSYGTGGTTNYEAKNSYQKMKNNLSNEDIAEDTKFMTQEGDTINKLMNGGFGLGHVCYPSYLPRLIATMFFPPLGVFLRQRREGKFQPTEIITSFILTALFYFPGLIHALHGLDCASHS